MFNLDRTTLRVPHSKRLYVYHTPTGSTSTCTTFTTLQTAPRPHLLTPDWPSSTSATHLHSCQCRVNVTSHKTIFPSFFTLTRFFSPRLPSAMSSIYDKGTGCERVPHWATRLCRWALCLAAPFPASRGSIPLCQAFIANAVAPRGPALRGSRIPEWTEGSRIPEPDLSPYTTSANQQKEF